MGRRHGWLRGVRAVVASGVIAAGIALGSAGPTRAAPTNDAFADAQPISGISGDLTGQNNDATLETGEPDHGKRGAFSLGAHASVWFRWTAPTTELMTFDVTCGATPCFLIPIVDVYIGSTVDTLTLAPDSAYTGWTKQFNAVAGTTYSIAVAGRSLGGAGTFRLRWGTLPGNDDFAAPQTITGTSGSLSISNVGATTEAGEPPIAFGALSASVWFTWTPTTAGTSNFSVAGSDAVVVLEVFTGGTLGGLTLVTQGPSNQGESRMPRVSFGGAVGTTYRVRVRGLIDGGRGTVNLSWSLGAPANDIGSSPTSDNDPIHAQTLREMFPYPGFSVVGSTIGASKDPGEADHAGDPGGHSVWYSFVATMAGAPLTFDTVGSSFDTVLAIYADGVLIAEDDDSAGGGASRASFTTRTLNSSGTALVEYLIAVDGKAGATGPLRLNWYFSVPPNDDFADAEPIAGISGLRTWDLNFGASIEAGEPDHGYISYPHTGRFTSSSVWYEWTAPQDGSATFSTFGSNGLGVLTFAPVIDVYTGATLDALTVVSPQSRPTSDSVQFTAVEGEIYRIVIAGLEPFAKGNIRLQWSDVFPFPERATTTSVECDATTPTVGIAYGCTATVTDVDSSPSSDGWKGDPGGVARITLVGVTPAEWGCTLAPDGNPATYSSSCTIAQFPDAVPVPATGTAAAEYLETSSLTSSLLHAASADPDGFGPITISARASATEVLCTPASVVATSPVTCTATVIEGSFGSGLLPGLQSAPAGTVSFSTGDSGAFTPTSCVLAPLPLFSQPRGACSVTYTPSLAGWQRIDAAYATDRVHASSADPDGFTIQVTQKPRRSTATQVSCVPQRFRFGDETTTCTATVDDVHVGGQASPPLGTVNLTSDHGGSFASCALTASDADSSSCSATYVPAYYGFGSHHMGSSYGGSDDHAPSTNADSTFVVLLRDTATSIECDLPLVIGQASACTVSVTDTEGDNAGYAPYDIVELIAEGPGTLSAPSCFLSNVSSGSPLSQCSVTYTPSAVGDGVHAITATYPGPLNGIYLPSTGSVDLPLATDEEAPITTAEVIAGTAGTPPWYRSASVTVRLSATDAGSGVDSITYRVDGGAPVVVEAATTDVVLTGNGLRTVAFAATDGASNTEATTSFTVGIDTVAPTLTVTGVADGATYTVGSVPAPGCTATDNLAAAGSLTGSPTVVVTPLPAGAEGAHTAQCSISDQAGNQGSTSATYTVVAAPRPDEVSVRYTGSYTFATSGTVTSGDIVEGTRTLAGVVTVGPGTTVALDCTNVRAQLGLATCVVRVTAPALGSAPVVTSGVALYARTRLSGDRVRHELVMVGLRPERTGRLVVLRPYRLQVTVVDAG